MPMPGKRGFWVSP